jgi:hypothetical protein
MKRIHLFVLPVLAFGVLGVAQASPFPADAEASYSLPAADTYADRYARGATSAVTWGVSKRAVQPHNPFPFGGGYIDD